MRLVGLEVEPLPIDRPRATMPANKVQPAMVLTLSFIERISARVPVWASL
jgi:hypothetical protein